MLESQLEKWIVTQASRPVALALVLPSGNRIDLGPSPKVVMRLKDLSALRFLIHPTLANLGTAYVEGHVDLEGSVEDIIDVGVQLASGPNGEDFEEVSPGLFARLFAHTKSRDRAAIEYHYDVSNDFYGLFLDPLMVYSCGYFKNAADSLETAQQQKLDHILNKLQLASGESFLDIGCGWGALIIRAAQRGARAVGVTLSQNQHDYAKQRIEALGLSDRCEVRMQDYREIPAAERFDKIASVGMFEHVGTKNLPTYFDKVYALLNPRGAVLMHGITATDPDRRKVGRGGGDFIDKYVFPDGELPHASYIMESMAHAGFEVVDAESLRRHYALTLSHWARRLDDHASEAIASAGDKRFRIWRVYLAGCAFGFANNWMNIYQMLACKLGDESHNPFPLTREWMYRP